MPAALDAVGSWPVPDAAAAVIGPSGVLAAHGDTSTRFSLASVTKPLASLAVLVAVEEEAVSLDDPVAGWPDVTVRHLLAHAAGFAFDQPSRIAPVGSRRVYSNVGIDLAGAHVAAATDMPFGQYVDDALTRQLGLASTTVGAHPSADGVSSVDDLAAVVGELLSPTGLLHEPLLTELRSVQFGHLRGVLPGFGLQAENDWGLGFEIRGMKTPHWTGTTNSASTYGHFGQAGTFLWIDPGARLGLVALTDRDFGDWARTAWPALSDAVLAEFA